MRNIYEADNAFVDNFKINYLQFKELLVDLGFI